MVIFDQSAVIPYRKTSEGIEIMLVSTKEGNWTIPKGTIATGLSPRKSAAKEALEEAGIEGKVKKGNVGIYTYNKQGDNYCVKVYKMKVKKIHKKWDEQHIRERVWVDLDSISKFIKYKNLLTIIKSAF
ncbi:hypothetical protein MNBD_IGNAVI01-233 [hydrothermal vent metagenome]|uniref:Nudix hydrolase domain-containing protein n=1 Tax=hydrothermal vent metagenome TaxID=652676 RepID=A0A3B1DAS4_9ZZZZ